MPNFSTPFATTKKLSLEELIRTIRFFVAAEYEAIQMYMEVVDSTDNALAKAVLTKISDEEKVHAGEFLRLIHQLDPEEIKYYNQGAAEVEDEIKKIKPTKRYFQQK